MNILLISASMNDRNGGASRVYHMLAEQLRVLGHRVTIHHGDEMDLPRASGLGLLSTRIMLPRYVSRFARRVYKHDYDIVMSSSGLLHPFFAELKADNATTACVTHSHGLSVFQHIGLTSEGIQGNLPLSRLYREVTAERQIAWECAGIANADLAIVQNQRDAGWIGARFPSTSCRIVEPALDGDLLRALPSGGISPEGRQGKLLWLATWLPGKGSAYIPQAFRTIRTAHPETRLTLAGTGVGAADVLAVFDARDRDAVTVVPRYEPQQQKALLTGHSIFLFPTASDGFGLALLEAAAYDMQIVSTLQAGFTADHLADAPFAKLIYASAPHLAKATIALLDHPASAQIMAAGAARIARLFTAERMGKLYEASFEAAIETAQTRSGHGENGLV